MTDYENLKQRKEKGFAFCSYDLRDFFPRANLALREL